MKKVFLLLFWVMVSSAFAQTPISLNTKPQQLTTAKSPESVGFSSEKLARIDALMQEKIKQNYIPYASMVIVRKGQIVYYKAFGNNDQVPLQKDDIFRIMSCSKAITAVAVMMLYEEGKFQLDDPLSKYIPEFKNPKVLAYYNDKDTTYSGVPVKKEPTIRNLLTHTAGIPYSHPLYKKAGIPDFYSLDNLTIAQTMPKLAALPLMHEPGEKFTYGLNYDMLGYLIERVSGMRFGEFLQKRIFDPLGMNDTGFYQPANKKNRIMHVYMEENATSGLKLHKNPTEESYPVEGAKTYESGGAGLTSTVVDYAKFLQMLINGGSFNGKQLLGRKTVELMGTSQVGTIFQGPDSNSFGLGFEIVTEKGHSKEPGSVGTMSWGGRDYSTYWFDPKEELLAVWTTQVVPSQHGAVGGQFKQLVYQALAD